jgi:hypothetical protein
MMVRTSGNVADFGVQVYYWVVLAEQVRVTVESPYPLIHRVWAL